MAQPRKVLDEVVVAGQHAPDAAQGGPERREHPSDEEIAQRKEQPGDVALRHRRNRRANIPPTFKLEPGLDIRSHNLRDSAGAVGTCREGMDLSNGPSGTYFCGYDLPSGYGAAITNGNGAVDLRIQSPIS